MNQYDVIVVGGGVIGVSIAWHSVQKGLSVLLCERKQLTSGTTWHAAGLVGQARMGVSACKIARYSMDFIENLHFTQGFDIGLKQNGSLSIALTQERLHEFKRISALSQLYENKIENLSKEQIAERFSYIETEQIEGGIFIHKDGQVNPVDFTQAMAKQTRAQGGVIQENCTVKKIIQQNGKIIGIETEKETIYCKHLVVAGGMWSRDLLRQINVDCPLYAAEHFYIVSEPSNQIPSDMPIIRVPDEYAYYKEDAGKLLLGAFEPKAKPYSMDKVKETFAFETLPEDFEHFEEVFTLAVNRMPMLESLGMQLFFNGPESFTPDDQFHCSKYPLIDNLYICAGFNSIGIQSSPATGKAIVEMIQNNRASIDLSAFEVQRFHPYQNNLSYLWHRTTETLGLLYQPHYPYKQYETARDLRRSPFHHYLKQNNAVFGEAGGWERPNFYALEGMKKEYEYSWWRQNWHQAALKEALATRDDVALYDQTSFAKFYVEGKDALALLQKLSCNQIDVPVNNVVYTQWLNEIGGIEADVTVTRLTENSFLVVTGAMVETRDYMRLKKYQQEFENVFVMNITHQMPMLGLMGAKAKDLLQKLTMQDLSIENFAFSTSKECTIGMYPVRLTRITFVGESGFEVYCASDVAQQVFEKIMQLGVDYNLTLAGYHTLNGCRLEKSFRHFGHDITGLDTLPQAGLSFTAQPDVKDFIGREALIKEKEQGIPQRRLVQFMFLDESEQAPLVFHDEPIFENGRYIGNVTSGSWGYRLNRSLGMGYVTHQDNVWKDFLSSGSFSINIAGQHHKIKAQLKAFYDPSHSRMKN